MAQRRHRYSAWDGTQQSPLDADQIMQALSDDLIEFGDMRWAMRNLLSRGMPIPQGGYMQGLRDMIQKLKEQKRRQLKRYNLDALFEEFRERLDEILAMERETIAEWKTKDEANFSEKLLKDIAQRNEQTLDALPEDLASQVKALETFEFINTDAQKKFIELLNELKKAMAQTFFKDIENMVNNLSQGDIDRMKDMLKALNDMLVKRIAGEDPEFDAFMDEFGDMFGEDPPRSLDELLAQMQEQMAATQALMNSLSDEQRQALQSLFDGRFGDPELDAELAKLAKELDFLGDGGGYNFSGDESVDFQEALRLMRELQEMDDLLDQMQGAERSGDLRGVDQDLLRDVLGDEDADQFDALEEMMKMLEDAGYVRRNDDGWELTPRGSRVIGQKALGEIYQKLKRQNLGNHAVPEEGRFGERLEDTKPYEFGDPFHLHMPRTIRNAISRSGHGTPVQLQPDDFEIYRSETITSTATAMLVDLSWSMALRGSFQAAKKVALALHNLITSQYPKDSFYIIGFAAYAKQLKAHDLPHLQWDEYVLGTNMQHALLMAERLLAKHPAGSKQVIMISDGEPTAHIENGEAMFAYPPTPETIRATFRAVKRCTKKGIAINTFMLEESDYLRAFMQEVARINGGRVFYTSPENLGEYILVDFVQNKRRKLGR